MLDILVGLGVSQAAQTLLYPVLEDIFKDVAEDAAKNYVSEAFKNVFSPINRKTLSKATAQALLSLLDLIENELLDNDVSEERVRSMSDAVKVFLKKTAVQEALAQLFLEPDYHLDPKVFAQSWEQLPYPWPVPEDFSWQRIAKRFARKVRDIRDSDIELKQTFDNLQQHDNAEALKALQGLPPDFDLDTYREAVYERFGHLSLDSMDTSGAYYAVQLWSVFVPQSVRECHSFRPQMLELPKEHLQRLLEQGEIDEEELQALEKQQDKQRSSYLEQPLQPVMELLKPDKLDSNMVILGDPGSGKSSLLRFLALEWARNENAHQRYTQALPLLIELRDYNRWPCPSGKSFLRYLHEAPTWHRLNQHTLDYLLKQERRVILLLDGLDEVFDPVEREHVTNDIHRFSNEYKHTRIILTSRVVGYKPQRLRDAAFRDFMLQDFDAEHIHSFLQRWHSVAFKDKSDGEAKRERLAKAINSAKSIQMLAGNPLLLTMMAIINRYQELPRDRVLLYEKASEVLLQQWDTERGLQDFPGLSADIDLRAKKAILRRIAYTMQTGKAEGQAANIIHGEALLNIIENYLCEELHFGQARAAANALIQQLRERNFILCFLGADSYAFVHRTFLEYFCAAELVYLFKDKQSLKIEGLMSVFDKYCRDDDWREVLRLVCGQIDEKFVGQIVEFLVTRTNLESWDGETELPEMILAIWCLSEAKNPMKLSRTSNLLIIQIIKMLTLIEPVAFSVFSSTHESATEFYKEFGQALITAIQSTRNSWVYTCDLTNNIHSISLATESGKWLLSEFIGTLTKDKNTLLKLIQYNDEKAKTGAFRAIANYWVDNESQSLLESYLQTGDNSKIRVVAMKALAKSWVNTNTRTQLNRYAVKDEYIYIRQTAINELAENWPDDDTRRLLTERAVEDEHYHPRSAALSALAEKWPDDDTRRLLIERLFLDGFAAYWRGKEHSRFGEVVFYKAPRFSRLFGYLNPRQAIPREHIEEAAKKAHVPADQINETVQSLSAHMGWDITKGSEHSTMDNERHEDDEA